MSGTKWLSAPTAISALAYILIAAAAQPVHAQVPTDCNQLSGIPQALCVSYCDVQHCNTSPNASCETLRTQYQQQTGRRMFPCDCPTSISFEGTPGSLGVLDSGWTGQSHDATVVDRGKLTVGVTGCAHPAPPCGVCNLAGPVPNMNADAGDINNRRCTGNTRTKCTTNADCSGAGGGGTCEYYFGSLLPLSAGGVSTCVSNQVSGGVSGTADVDGGTSATAVRLVSRVFSGVTVAAPCPKCVGDATPNDGARAGTCDSGQNSGQTCDVNGTSPNVFFGATSLDCPPTGGALIASLPIDLSNSTGTVTRTLTAQSPLCRAPGFTTLSCF